MSSAALRPADTTPEAWSAQVDMLRRMDASQRLAIAFRLSDLARGATRSGIRARHPEYGEPEVRRAFFRLLHGDDLTLAVWPHAELLDP